MPNTVHVVPALHAKLGLQVDGDQVRLFYRMQECPDQHSTWVALNEVLPWALCCENGRFESCRGIIDCECYKGENRG